MLRPGILSGTRRVTTAPIIRLRTGNDPAYKVGAKVLVKNIPKIYRSILSDKLITFRALLHSLSDVLWQKLILLPGASAYMKKLSLARYMTFEKKRRISLCYDYVVSLCLKLSNC